MPARSPGEFILVGPAAPYRGGIAHFLHATYDGLIRRGRRVEIVNFSRQYPGLLFPGKTQYDTMSSEAAPPSLRLLDSINPFTWIRAARYIRKRRPDAVVFNHWMPFFAPAYGFIARRLKARGIRVLCIAHNALPHEKRPGDRAVSKYFFGACDGFIVMSDAVARDLAALGARGTIYRTGHPVYEHFGNPVPAAQARERLGLKPGQPILLFFGFIRRYKGLHVLLESMPAVVEALPDVALVVAGECYEDERKYRDLVVEQGLSTNVNLRFEYIPDSVVPDLFSAADVVVQPYISATQSGVAQIAYYFERPLIVTDVGGLAEVVPHERAGLVVPPEDPRALAAAIVRFFEEDMAGGLKEGVLAEKENHGWERFLDVLEEAAGAGGPSSTGAT